ncbi:MAG: DNA repair protein RadC [Nitrospiraceae bacterium]|nr:DNA repair protein RadC [Nitrospiraceae bacterium]
MTYRSIREWPEDERPRERLLRHGPEHLSDAHLIAISLRTGGSGRSAVDIALELLATFGSLRKIGQASAGEICAIKGLGPAKAAQLKAALELGMRAFREPAPKGPFFSTGRDVYDYFHPRLSGLKKEVFCCALLDVKNRLLCDFRVSEGTLTSSLIHPREAFLQAVRESAASVIFVHNHPSGDPEPSRDDIQITGRLEQAGEMLGIKLLDHVIVGDGRYASMLEKGYLKAG